MTHSITSKYNYGCYLNIQKKLNFYALQLALKGRSAYGELRAFAFCQKTKKNQNKEEKIIVFCWLSTSLVKGFSFSFMEEKILYFFLQRLISKIPEKKKRNQENVCPSRSIWYLGIHIFLKIEKNI